MSIVDFLNARLAERESAARTALAAGENLRSHGVSPDLWEERDLQANEDLADVAAHRKLIEAHVGYYGAGDDEGFPIQTLSILAERYSTHPGYDPAWAPTVYAS